MNHEYEITEYKKRAHPFGTVYVSKETIDANLWTMRHFTATKCLTDVKGLSLEEAFAEGDRSVERARRAAGVLRPFIPQTTESSFGEVIAPIAASEPQTEAEPIEIQTKCYAKLVALLDGESYEREATNVEQATELLGRVYAQLCGRTLGGIVKMPGRMRGYALTVGADEGGDFDRVGMGFTRWKTLEDAANTLSARGANVRVELRSVNVANKASNP